MNDFASKCFVCQKMIDPQNTLKNKDLNLPVCTHCSGSDQELEKVNELKEGLADDFVCGCI